MGGGVLGWGVPSTSSKLLSHSPALTHELLTELAPAWLFQMLMTSSAESLKLGHAIQPVVFGEALLMLETVVSPLPPPPLPSWSFVCCGNRHRCSSCLTQGHFPPNRHLVCGQLSPAPATPSLSFFLTPSPVLPHPFLHFFFFFAPLPRPLRDGLPWCPPNFSFSGSRLFKRWIVAMEKGKARRGWTDRGCKKRPGWFFCVCDLGMG